MFDNQSRAGSRGISGQENRHRSPGGGIYPEHGGEQYPGHAGRVRSSGPVLGPDSTIKLDSVEQFIYHSKEENVSPPRQGL